MTILEDLAEKLSKMCLQAPEGDKVAMIHLFGIRYAKIIHDNGITPKQIVDETQINNLVSVQDSYATEISKGIKLAKYVTDKEPIINFINRH